MSLVAYVSEDGLVGHHWKESRPLVLQTLYASVQGNARDKSGGGGKGNEWGEGMGTVGIALEM